MKPKRPTTGKRGQRDKNSAENCDYSQNDTNAEELNPTDVELQKWRSNRVNYLKSRVSHIYLKSPSPISAEKSTQEENQTQSPELPSAISPVQSPLQMSNKQFIMNGLHSLR
uniref:Uncharacterized protein n=1 Tax=Setaria digitata TaxID=48799 RepID=A0A915Q4J7_9BILA